MGGIAGVIHFTGEAPDRDQAHQLSAGVARRGRDDKGAFSEGPVSLVHRQISCDRQGVRQPLVGERFVLAMDGRLYNGETAEGLLRRWEAEGSRCLPEIDGEFALAVWDRRKRALWLARDACGARPLFWASSGGKLAFASEIPPLLGLPWVSRDIAVYNLAEYLSFRYVHAPRTLLQDVSAVPPGHLVRIDSAGAEILRWWRPPWAAPDAALPEPEAAVQLIDELLRRGVTERLQAEVPVGILLSGGLDSSAVLYHAAQLHDAPLAFTVSLEGDPVDESPFAARVAKVMGAQHHIVRVQERDFVEGVSAATKAMGQPLPTAAAAVQGLLFAEVRRSVKVLLSGDGGDEVLAGRGVDRIARRLRGPKLIAQLPGPARLLARSAARLAQKRDLAATVTHFGLDRGIGGSRVFHSAERVALLADPGLVRPGIRQTVLEPLYQEVDSSPINNILHVWQRGWLPEDGLARSDRMAAAAGLEVRYPMLDRELLRACARLPGEFKVQGRLGRYVTKWPLRKAMERRLPRQLLHRPKRSLPNPLDAWLRGPGADFLRAEVEAICERDADLFVPSAVRALAADHREGEESHGLKLWTLILFSIWRRTVL